MAGSNDTCNTSLMFLSMVLFGASLHTTLRKSAAVGTNWLVTSTL